MVDYYFALLFLIFKKIQLNQAFFKMKKKLNLFKSKKFLI